MLPFSAVLPVHHVLCPPHFLLGALACDTLDLTFCSAYCMFWKQTYRALSASVASSVHPCPSQSPSVILSSKTAPLPTKAPDFFSTHKLVLTKIYSSCLVSVPTFVLPHSQPWVNKEEREESRVEE